MAMSSELIATFAHVARPWHALHVTELVTPSEAVHDALVELRMQKATPPVTPMPSGVVSRASRGGGAKQRA